MKVLLINGSPHTDGCTNAALTEIATTLQKDGIETEIFQIGTQDIRGCIACGKCSETGQCIFSDCVNTILEKAETADGFIFGSPVYYASANGSMVSLMDRLFYASKNQFAYKPAAVVASARRAGTTATLDQLNKYLQISQMITVPSCYWNMVHGSCKEDVAKDLEGLQIMRTLGKNMSWLLRMKECATTNQISLPESEPRVRTNFIR